jgi:thiol-disulfide isomerase/thioredoxin
VTTTGWLAFIGGLALADLLFILLVARRVRELAKRPREPFSTPWLDPGARVREFEAVTTAGDRVSLERLRGRDSVVGFFSTGCRPCQEQLPIFAELAAANAANGQSRLVLAVLVGPAAECADYVAALEGKAMVVREDRRGTVTTAFATHAFPGIYLLDPRGTVVARGPSVAVINGRTPDPVADRR